MAEPARSRPAEGVALFVTALLLISVVDGLAKHLGRTASPLFVSWGRYAVATLIVLPVTAIMHGRALFPRERWLAHVQRTVFLVLAMTLYFVAIRRVPLASAVSAYLVAPVIAVVLSVLILKERLTPRKVAALVLGAAGSLVMLRPGGTTDPWILLAFGSGIVFALYLVTTRQAALDSDPVQTLAFQCCAGTLLLTPQAIATWHVPAASDLAFYGALGAFSAGGHILAILAFRRATASTLAPIVYVELIGAALVGYFAFAEVPDTRTIAGSALIVAAGLILIRDQ